MAYEVLLIAGVVTLVVVAILIARHLDKKRTEAWRAFAAEKGWSFTDRDRDTRPSRYARFEPFGKGSKRYARWVLSGTWDDAPFELFTYHYEVRRSNGKTSRTDHYWFKVCTLEMPIASPGLSIKDEHIGHKLWDAIGGEDLDVEHDAFSRRFWVKAQDRRFAYDVLHPGMIEYVLPTRGWTWQWRGTTLLLFDEGKLKREECEAMLALVHGVRARLPRHLIHDRARG